MATAVRAIPRRAASSAMAPPSEFPAMSTGRSMPISWSDCSSPSTRLRIVGGVPSAAGASTRIRRYRRRSRGASSADGDHRGSTLRATCRFHAEGPTAGRHPVSRYCHIFISRSSDARAVDTPHLSRSVSPEEGMFLRASIVQSGRRIVTSFEMIGVRRAEWPPMSGRVEPVDQQGRVARGFGIERVLIERRRRSSSEAYDEAGRYDRDASDTPRG